MLRRSDSPSTGMRMSSASMPLIVTSSSNAARSIGLFQRIVTPQRLANRSVSNGTVCTMRGSSSVRNEDSRPTEVRSPWTLRNPRGTVT